MATWILYADPQQLVIKDWAAHEGALRKLGLSVEVPKGMDVGAPNAYVIVEDPDGLLDDSIPNGRERREALRRRVRAMIRWLRQKQEKGAKGGEK